MNTHDYKICARCVMDTTDPKIRFDASGVCRHCTRYDQNVAKKVFRGDQGRLLLQRLVRQIKADSAGQKYDCVVGVSGGIDSTYAVWKAKELGLRPLAVHLDNGWDSELAVSNIYNVLSKLDVDLHTHVIDWDEFRDLQLSFLKAGTPDSEIPSDHAIMALMYQVAEQNQLRYVISGCNVLTESHLPSSWSQGHWDWRYIRSVHSAFGKLPLRTYPHLPLRRYCRYRIRMRWIDILNYCDYTKDEAKSLLGRETGWRDYGGKHYESIYTRFYQGYILPRKFGFDKRRTHYSSLICSQQMTRDQALALLADDPYAASLQEQDKVYVMKKLGLTEAQFQDIMQGRARSYWDFPSYGRIGGYALHKVLVLVSNWYAKREAGRV